MFSSGIALVALAQLQICYVAATYQNHGHKSSERWLPRVPVGDAPPAEMLVSELGIPQTFDWRNINGDSYVVTDVNQHIPQYCGSCWIHGTVAALNDRIKVLRGAKFPDVMLGRQAIVNCVPGADGGPPPGCNGGDAWMIHKYMHTTKVPDESCLPYQARNMGCEPVNVCRNCAVNGTCWPVKSFIGYGVSSYGKVRGEEAMKKEIYSRGPIVCSFAADDDFVFRFSEHAVQNEGVYIIDRKYNASQVDHDMEVTGWGETPSGIKYWVIRNSWGTFWGESGWLKLRRGTNELRVESDCDWAVPTWDDLDEALAGKVLGDYALGDLPVSVTAGKIEGKVFGQLALAASGSISMGNNMILVAATAFFGGCSVALTIVMAAGRKRVERQPFILG